MLAAAAAAAGQAGRQSEPGPSSSGQIKWAHREAGPSSERRLGGRPRLAGAPFYNKTISLRPARKGRAGHFWPSRAGRRCSRMRPGLAQTAVWANRSIKFNERRARCGLARRSNLLLRGPRRAGPRKNKFQFLPRDLAAPSHRRASAGLRSPPAGPLRLPSVMGLDTGRRAITSAGHARAARRALRCSLANFGRPRQSSGGPVAQRRVRAPLDSERGASGGAPTSCARPSSFQIELIGLAGP